jgi:hypothetical protein
MNCPECGATVGADEKFCGNCGTPVQGSIPQTGADAGVQPQDSVESTTDHDAAQADMQPAWDSTEQETIYSEPAQLAQDPMLLSAPNTHMPDPAGTPEESITPSSLPPLDDASAAEKGSKNKIIIAVVVLIVLLLCCCVAVIVALVMFGWMEESQSLYMAIPSLATAL